MYDHSVPLAALAVLVQTLSGAPVDAPLTAVATPYGDPACVVWLDRAPDLFGSRTGSQAQARAPPLLT